MSMTKDISMRSIRSLAALLLASAAIPISAQEAAPVGINAAIRNSVQMRTAARPLHPAVLRERVSIGDEVQTGSASVLQILLLDKTAFTVGANARVKIDRFVYDPNRSTSSVGVSVAQGAFRFMSGKSLRGAPGQSSVKTPIASIGIRGTIFEGVIGNDALRIAKGEAAVGAAIKGDAATATLIVLRGPGQTSQGDEKPGAVDITIGDRIVAIETPGLAVFIPGPNQAPIGPFPLSEAGFDALQALLRTSPDRRNRRGAAIDRNPIVDLIFECLGGGGSSSQSAGGCGALPADPFPSLPPQQSP